MRFDMLEVKKDRVKEIDIQIKRCNMIGNWILKSILRGEKQTLLQEIKDIENKRGENNAKGL